MRRVGRGGDAEPLEMEPGLAVLAGIAKQLEAWSKENDRWLLGERTWQPNQRQAYYRRRLALLEEIVGQCSLIVRWDMTGLADRVDGVRDVLSIQHEMEFEDAREREQEWLDQAADCFREIRMVQRRRREAQERHQDAVTAYRRAFLETRGSLPR